MQGLRIDAEELHAAVADGISRNLVLDRSLQPMGDEKVPHGFGSQVNHGARFGERAVVKGQLGANGVVELAIGEPRQVVKVSWNARRFCYVEGHLQAVGARLKVVSHLGEEAALHQFVRGCL